MADSSSYEPVESPWCRRLPLVLALVYGVLGAFYIFVSDALLLMLIGDAEHLTALQTLKGWLFVLFTSILLYLLTSHGVRRIREADRAGRRSHERFHQMIQIANEGVWVLDENGGSSFVNETMARMLGYSREEIEGRRIEEFVHPEFRRTINQRLEMLRAGEPSQYECRLLRHDGASVWVIVSAAPLHGDDGRFEGALNMVTDISHRKETEDALESSLEGQRALLNELDHRVRNNLSSVLGLIQLARRGADDPDALAESVSGRIRAMSSAYALVSASGWHGQELDRLIGALLPNDLRDRVKVDGESVRVPARQVGALAIVIHELLSNAIRHGALAARSGRVIVNWRRAEPKPRADDGEKRMKVEMDWVERNGPPIEREPPAGSGCRLIDGLCRSDLRGRADLRFPPEGAEHHFEIELVTPPRPDAEVKFGGERASTAAS